MKIRYAKIKYARITNAKNTNAQRIGRDTAVSLLHLAAVSSMLAFYLTCVSPARADDTVKSPKTVGRDTDGRSLSADTSQEDESSSSQNTGRPAPKAETADKDILIDDDRNDDEFLKHHGGAIGGADDYNEEDEQE